MQLAIEGYENGGSNYSAADAAGVSEFAIRFWRKHDPAFDEALQRADDTHAGRLSRKSKKAIEKHLDDYLEGRRARRQMVVQKTGEVVEVEEPISLSPAIVDRALNRTDPRWTKPKEQVEHSGAISITDAVADARKRLAESPEGETGDAGADAPT